jgi:hypothetical protein
VIYAVVALVVLFFSALIWTYTRGVQVTKLKKDLENAKDYAWKQTQLIGTMMKVIRRQDDLEGFLDKLNACDNAAEFSEMFNSQLSERPSSSTSGVEGV